MLQEWMTEAGWWSELLVAALMLLAGFVAAIWLFRLFKRVLRRYKNPALHRVAGFVQYPLKVLVLLVALNFVRLRFQGRSEEHTSELQSRPHLVCRLLL